MPLPTGTLTFLFTDIEGSTQLWEQQWEAMRSALARHDEMLRLAIEDHNGTVLKTTGDGLLAVFEGSAEAVPAALAGQRAILTESWNLEPGQMRIRAALLTGAAEVRDGDCYGPAVNRAARLTASHPRGEHETRQQAEGALDHHLDKTWVGKRHVILDEGSAADLLPLARRTPIDLSDLAVDAAGQPQPSRPADVKDHDPKQSP